MLCPGRPGTHRMWNHLASLLYFMAPAWLANMAPPFVRFWHGWNRPLHARWFGSHKTVAGAWLGLAVAVGVRALLALPHMPFDRLPPSGWWWQGPLYGLGVVGGDALKSFCKRRAGIAPGRAWPPFDQLDFALGTLFLLGIPARLNLVDVAVILALTFVGGIGVDRVSFRLGIKRSPW